MSYRRFSARAESLSQSMRFDIIILNLIPFRRRSSHSGTTTAGVPSRRHSHSAGSRSHPRKWVVHVIAGRCDPGRATMCFDTNWCRHSVPIVDATSRSHRPWLSRRHSRQRPHAARREYGCATHPGADVGMRLGGRAARQSA